MEVARRFTRRLHELPSEELELIAGLFVRREVHKGERLSSEKDIARDLVFVEKGLLRQFYFKEGRDITENFACDGDGAMCIVSLFTGRRNCLQLESLEEGVIWSISYAGLVELSERYLHIARLLRHLLEGSLMLSHHPEQMDVCLCLHVLHPVLLPRRGCHTVERNIYSRPAASGICGCGRKLPCLYLHNECTEAVAPHCGEHVQLHAAHRGLNRCHHLRIGSVQFGKGNSHSLGIPGSVHRDTKQVTQGFRERRESRIKQPFHRHSTPARTRLRDSGVINR